MDEDQTTLEITYHANHTCHPVTQVTEWSSIQLLRHEMELRIRNLRGKSTQTERRSAFDLTGIYGSTSWHGFANASRGFTNRSISWHGIINGTRGSWGRRRVFLLIYLIELRESITISCTYWINQVLMFVAKSKELFSGVGQGLGSDH